MIYNKYFSLQKGTMTNFARESYAQEMETFFAKHDPLGAKKAVQRALENIRIKVQHINREQDAFVQYFTEKVQTWR